MKIFYTSFFIVLSWCLSAQTNDFSITTLTLQSGIFFPEQLFGQVIISNNTLNSSYASLTIEIESGSGESVMTASTQNFDVLTGINTFDISNDLGYNVLYGGGSLAQALQYTGFFPVSDYTICYTLNHITQTTLATTCAEFNVEGMVGPVALTPLDGDTIVTCIPSIVWVPVFPSYPGVNYELVISQVLNNQTATDAINFNTPFAVVSGLTYNSFLLTSSYGSLMDSTLYAWQVTALTDQNTVLGQSEPEMFVPVCDIEENIDTTLALSIDGYIEPVKNMADGYYSVHSSDTFKILIRNVSGDEFLNYSISYIDTLGEVVEWPFFELPVYVLTSGVNLIDLPFSQFSGTIKEKDFFSIRFKQKSCDYSIKYLYLPEE